MSRHQGPLPPLVKCSHCGYPAYSINYLSSEPEAKCPKCNQVVYKKAEMNPLATSKPAPMTRMTEHRCGSCASKLSLEAIEKKYCQACGVKFSISGTKTYDTSKEVRCSAIVGSDFVGPPKPEPKVSKGIAVRCGCQRHFVAIDEDKVVHYKGNWWKLGCLFIRVDRRMRKIIGEFEKMEKEVKAYHKMRLKFIRMKKFLRQLPCSHCGAPVGNRFIQTGDAILCGECRHNTRDL